MACMLACNECRDFEKSAKASMRPHLGLKWLHCYNELQCTAGVRLEIVCNFIESSQVHSITTNPNFSKLFRLFCEDLWTFPHFIPSFSVSCPWFAFYVHLLQALCSVWLALSDDTNALKLSVPEQGPWIFCDLWLEVFGGPWANSPDQPWQLCNQPWLILARGLLSLTER